MRDRFEQETEALAALERVAADNAGVPALGDRLEETQRKLADIDEAIDRKEAGIRALVAERRRFASGNDDGYREATGILREAMRRQGVALLRERAARTARPEDDALVEELADLEGEIRRIEQDLTELRGLHERENERVGGLEDVRRRFKASGFDDKLSEFVNGALIAVVLSEFLSGSARADQVWRTIRRQQRKRRVHADPNFGTLGFPRAGRHGPWRMPGGFGRGGFGGGGFRTGGGFRGGGGFKTGGGF